MNPGQLEELRLGLSDRYRIDEPVGEGAMAVVYRAWDLRHDRPVALKVLRAEIREHIGSERFLREVQVAARLQHPLIVPLFDSGSAAGHVYYVMPFLTGETLRARMDRDGPLAVEEALGIALQVAEALGHAHRHGVIHRDIKPENILLQEGIALAADFGVAFATSGDARLTATGFTVGTPAYMSPEQATGAPVDGRSDVYSLAAVLYEMLTDELPHPGRSAAETVARKLTEAPRSIRDLRRNVPAPMIAAVERALARAPQERFGSIDDFAGALEGRVTAVAAAGSGGRRAWSVGAGLVGAALLVIAGMALVRSRRQPEGAIDPFLIAAAPLESADRGLAATLEQLLGARLPGAPGPRLVPIRGCGSAAARREAGLRGAGRLLRGSADVTAGGVTVRLELEDRLRGRVMGQVAARGSRDSLPALAETLALGVLRLEASRGDPAVAATLPSSITPLTALTTGMAHYRMARYPSAGESFRRAIEADSSFALAGLWLVLTGREYGYSDGAVAFAWARQSALSPRDRGVLRAMVGKDYPAGRDLRTTLADLEEAVFANDDRPELWTALGTFLARFGPFLGLPDGATRAEGALQQALRYDPDRLAALERLVEVRGLLGDGAGLRSAARRFLAVDSTSELAPFVRWRLALADGDSATRRRLQGDLDNWNGVSLHQLIWTTQLEGLPPENALAASEALLRRATNAAEQRDRLITRHDVLANAGRPAEAAAAIRQMRTVEPAWSGWLAYALGDALFWDGEARLAAEAVDSLQIAVKRPGRDSAGVERQRRAACQLGFWDAVRGSAEPARRAASLVERLAPRGAPDQAGVPGCAFVILTVLAVRSGESDARSRVDSLERVVRTGQLLPGAGAGTNLLLARLRQELGDHSAARLAATRFWYWGRTVYVSSYLLQSGIAALQENDSVAARRSLLRVATLWAAGDSAHRARADSLRRLVAQLPLPRTDPGTP